MRLQPKIRSLPNGTKDEIRDCKLIKRVSDEVNNLQSADWVVDSVANGTDMETARFRTSSFVDTLKKSSDAVVETGITLRINDKNFIIASNDSQYKNDMETVCPKSNGQIAIRIKKTKLNNISVPGLIEYFTNNNHSLSYQLATPKIYDSKFLW